MASRYPLLVFPGALGVADGGSAASLFAPAAVTTFSYGEEIRIDSLLDRAVAEMTQAGAGQFDVIGFSIGGWFAQCLAARHPDLIRKVILAHSFILDRRDAWRFGLAARLWPLLPKGLIAAATAKRARVALEPVRRAEPALCETVLASIRIAVATPEVQARLVAQQLAARDSLLRMGGCLPRQPVLIIESDDDPLIGPRPREKLRRRFPAARTVTLRGAGHVSALSAPDALAEAVSSFLSG
jgi:pimeloyl-ACP methyl ester carboxylesterase